MYSYSVILCNPIEYIPTHSRLHVLFAHQTFRSKLRFPLGSPGFSAINREKWAKMGKNGRKWSKMVENGRKYAFSWIFLDFPLFSTIFLHFPPFSPFPAPPTPDSPSEPTFADPGSDPRPACRFLRPEKNCRQPRREIFDEQADFHLDFQARRRCAVGKSTIVLNTYPDLISR